MSKKQTTVLLLSIVFIVLIFFGISLYIKNELKLIDVYIAKYDLANRTKISENEIELVRVPENYLNGEIIVDKDSLIGKYVKINTSIPKGSFFYKGAIEDIEDSKDFIYGELKKDEVSFDLGTNEVKLNQAYLEKGMYVDLYLTINKDKVVSDLLINNVKIIGLYDINNKEIKDYDKDSILKTLSLAVPSDCVSYLNKARVVGELSIVVGNNTYTDVKTVLNKNESIFEYLD